MMKLILFFAWEAIVALALILSVPLILCVLVIEWILGELD